MFFIEHKSTKSNEGQERALNLAAVVLYYDTLKTDAHLPLWNSK